jgi:hypothetical protein
MKRWGETPSSPNFFSNEAHAYRLAGADNPLTVRIQGHAGHKVNPDSERASIDWFVKRLKP